MSAKPSLPRPAFPVPPTSARADSAADGADEVLARSPRGIQSVEVGGQLLQVLARSGRRMALGELARAAGMPAAKAHPYLVSYGKLGLIEQDAVSGHYGLGPLTLQLGLIGLQQVDPVRLAIGELPALAQRVGHTVSASVWGDGGPTIIRVEEAPTAVYVAMRHGTTASVRHTASGKVFAAFSARERIEAALVADGHAGALEDPAFAAELEAVRNQRLSVVHNQLLSGISALAAPVFDGFGQLVLALSVIGPSATLSVDPEGLPAACLRDTARALSERLGFAGHVSHDTRSFVGRAG
jgi:DNA-binding IclR family transcriptional regulator